MNHPSLPPNLAKEVLENQPANCSHMETDSNFMKYFHKTVDASLLFNGEMFVDCNEAAVKMLGASSKKEVLLFHPTDLSPEQQPDGKPSFETAQEMIAIAFKKGFHRFEWTHRKINGEEFPVEVSLTVIEQKGKPLLHVLWKDLTRQKMAEE